MRNPERIDRILEKLGKIWKQNPDLRLGQLLMNVDSKNRNDVFYIEDNEVEQGLDKVLNNGLDTVELKLVELSEDDLADDIAKALKSQIIKAEIKNKNGIKINIIA